MKLIRVDKFVLGILLILLLSIPMVAAAMETEDCLACHSEPDYVGDDLAIDGEAFMLTAHADFGCTTCHNSVTDEHPDDGEVGPSMSCTVCHDDVSDEYHQTAHADYADCTDCHKPHKAQGLKSTSAQGMNSACLQCHDGKDVITGHSEWLPRTELHVAKVPCITCHSATEGFQVVLQIDRKETEQEGDRFTAASYADLKKLTESKEISSLIDSDGDSSISMAELNDFKYNPDYKHLNISGTLVPLGSSHNLVAQENRYDCTFCHASGPQSTQNSVLALPTKSGRVVRLAVEESTILDALYGSPDFYLTGSSRNQVLDILGLIIVCAGFIMPVGHGTLRLLTRKNRKH